MKDTIPHIFIPSGCLTKDAIKRYIDYDLPKKDLKSVYEHLEVCNFCKDAVEGYQAFPSQPFEEDFSTLRSRIDKRSQKLTFLKNPYLVVGIAASLIIVFGLWGIYPILKTNSNNHLAYSSELLSRQVVYVPNNEPPVIIEEDLIIDSETEKFYIPVVDLKENHAIPEIEDKTKQYNLFLNDQKKPGIKPYGESKKKIKKLQKKKNIEDLIIFHDQPYNYGYSYQQTDRILMNVDFDNKDPKQEDFIEPTFRGKDISHFLTYLSDHLSYPHDVRFNQMTGILYMRFTINEYGEIVKPEIIQSLHPRLDLEAVNTVMEAKGWQPAYYMGKPVKIHFTIPVKFQYLD